MQFGELDELHEEFHNFCIDEKIHEVCINCNNTCKSKYRYWSGQLSPNMFCGRFEMSKLAKLMDYIIFG